MAKGAQSLASMSIDALLKLRDDIGSVLSEKAADLKNQLSRLAGGGDTGRGRRKKRVGVRKGRKVPPKYRDAKTGLTWAGRGARPRWMQEAIRGGAKQEDFLIHKTVAASRKKAAKKSRKRKYPFRTV